MTEEQAEAGEDGPAPAEPTDVKYVGPATAECLSEADLEAADILTKDVSYRELVDAGVNAGVATKIRREHSLSWSFGGDGSEDLDRRSEAVRGLQEGERAWVAASTGDWESTSPTTTSAEADGSGEATAAEAAWRERSRPDPVTEVPGVTEELAAELGKAGITSVRSLATANPETVADVIGVDADEIAQWREDAADIA